MGSTCLRDPGDLEGFPAVEMGHPGSASSSG